MAQGRVQLVFDVVERVQHGHVFPIGHRVALLPGLRVLLREIARDYQFESVVHVPVSPAALPP